MDFGILFLVDNDNKSTKSSIIQAIASAGELSVVQLQRLIRKDFGKRLSYQAIRQALMELIKAGAVIKNNKFFSINEGWILNLKDSIKILESAVKKRKIKTISKSTHQIRLRNLNDLGYFVLFGLEYKYFDFDKENSLYMQIDHLWIPFANMHRRENLIRLFKANNTYVTVNKNTLGDKILSQWYKKYTKLKLGVGLNDNAQYIVQGDCVVQIYMGTELKKRMDKLYKLSGIIRHNLFQELFRLTHDPSDIEIIITRNSKISEQIKNKIRGYF